jgi:hypothetical protein
VSIRFGVAAAVCACWLLIAQAAFAVQLDLSKPGENASEPAVATNAVGQAIVVWSRRDESTGFYTIQAASRQSTTTYQFLGNVSDGKAPEQFPQLAVDQAGNAVAVWEAFKGGHDVVQAAAFPPTFPPTSLGSNPRVTSLGDISDPGIDAQVASVAADPAGDAVAVWQQDVGNDFSIHAAARHAGGGFVSLGEVSKQMSGQDDEDPQVAIDQAGDAIVVWAHFDGANFVIQAALRPAGAAHFGTPFNVSVPPPSPEPPQEHAIEPHVAVDPAGDAVVVWTKRQGSTSDQVIQAAVLAHGATTFSSPQNLSPGGQAAESPGVTVDQAGDAVAAWQQFDGSSSMIDTASLSAFGGTWNAAAAIPSGGVGAPGIAGDAAGDVSLVWSGANGTSSDVVFTGRPAGGAFGDELVLSTPGQHATNPQVAVDQAGDAFVVWQRSDGKNTIISTSVPGTPGSGLPAPPGSVGGCVNHPGLPPCVPGPPTGQPPKPLLLRLTPGRFSTAGRLVHGHCVGVTAANRRHRTCTRPVTLNVSFRVRAAATITFTVQRATLGRIARRRRCVGVTTKNRGGRSCTRLITLRGRIIRHAHAGANRFIYTRRGLVPGSYRLLVTPSLRGRIGKPVTAGFRVVR